MFILSPSPWTPRRPRRDAPICKLSSTATEGHLEWGLELPSHADTTLVNTQPPLLRIHNLLSASQCAALVAMQKEAGGPERNNYLNHDEGVGNGFRQGVAPDALPLRPILTFLDDLLPGRRAQFAEALWHRPRLDTYVVRDVTTVCYGPGEGVASHVDGKDATLLIYLEAPSEGGHTVFDNILFSSPPVAGDALLYESRRMLTHQAAPVRQGVKWVLQVLLDYRVRADDR